MTVIGSYPVLRAPAQKRDGLSVHAVEKIQPRGHFHGEQQGRQDPPSWICTPLPGRKTYRNDTDQTVSKWDTPRLTPQFVAQVMGQVYCPHEAPPSAKTAYRPLQPPAPMLLDEKI